MTVVILGAGQAGTEAAAALRREGFDGRVVLVGAEARAPYQRPPLSKALLAGKASVADTMLRPEGFYRDHQIELRIGQRATAIERPHKRVRLADGSAIAYEHLVLATGASNRRFEVPGGELDGVLGLRTIEEALELRERLRDANRVAVVGAGFIGLEVAAVASAAGKEVDVWELADRPMSRVVSEPTSRFFARAHERRGVRIHFGSTVPRLLGSGGRLTGVESAGGERVAADVALAAIGIVPADSLAAAAGLRVRDGVCVDAQLLTEDPAISAIGDCARFPCRFASRPVILESVQNACDQGRAVAARLAGRGEPYAAVPWFWSDQGELRLQIAGLTVGADEVVLVGEPDSSRFSTICFARGRLVGVESVGRPGDHVAARRLLARTPALSPAHARRRDFDLKAYARAA